MTSPGFGQWLLTALLALGASAAYGGSGLCAGPEEEERQSQAVPERDSLRSGSPLVDEVCRDVAKLRELEFKRPVPLKLATRQEVEEFVLSEIARQWPKEQLEADERAFKVLGLLPQEYSLHQELTALYREQVAGLYDPHAGRMMLVKADSLKGLTKTLLSHELTHALQDQHFDLGRLIDRSVHTLDRDFTIACVAEGDTTVLMMDYMMTKGMDDPAALAGLLSDDALAQSKKLLSAPPLLRRMMLDPYLDGIAFVNHFRGPETRSDALGDPSRGSWERVNRIYDDFPLSAEQVMHPRKYYPRRDFPQRIDLARTSLGRAGYVSELWEMKTDTTLGEIGVLALVESWGELLKDEPLKQSAGKVAAGWDGDRLVSFEHWLDRNKPDNRRIVVYWVSTWDTSEDAREMSDALEKWGKKWARAETDRKYKRTFMLERPDVEGKPGLDVVCVLIRQRPGGSVTARSMPPYTKTVVHKAEDLTGRK